MDGKMENSENNEAASVSYLPKEDFKKLDFKLLKRKKNGIEINHGYEFKCEVKHELRYPVLSEFDYECVQSASVETLTQTFSHLGKTELEQVIDNISSELTSVSEKRSKVELDVTAMYWIDESLAKYAKRLKIARDFAIDLSKNRQMQITVGMTKSENDEGDIDIVSKVINCSQNIDVTDESICFVEDHEQNDTKDENMEINEDDIVMSETPCEPISSSEDEDDVIEMKETIRPKEESLVVDPRNNEPMNDIDRNLSDGPFKMSNMNNTKETNDEDDRILKEEKANDYIERPLMLVPGNAVAMAALENIGRDIFIYGSINPNKRLRLMIHISVNFPLNVMGGRVKNWLAPYSYAMRRKTIPMPRIRCQLDGQPFALSGITDTYILKLYPHLDCAVDPFSVYISELPCKLHTPDFALERVQLGEKFCRMYVLSVSESPDIIFLRNSLGHDLRKNFFRRGKRRSWEDGNRYRD